MFNGSADRDKKISDLVLNFPNLKPFHQTREPQIGVSISAKNHPKDRTREEDKSERHHPDPCSVHTPFETPSEIHTQEGQCDPEERIQLQEEKDDRHDAELIRSL